MKHLWIWLLAGMLVASVGYNIKAWTSGTTAGCCASCCGGKLDLAALDLKDDQVRALQQCCSGCSGALCGDEASRTKADRVLVALRDKMIPKDQVKALAADLADSCRDHVLRQIDSLLAARDVLTDKQLGQLRTCCTEKSE